VNKSLYSEGIFVTFSIFSEIVAVIITFFSVCERVETCSGNLCNMICLHNCS
jgi:hypothetical protein